MKRLLFIATSYHQGERIYPALDTLCGEFEVDIMTVGRGSDKFPWYGDVDLRPKLWSRAKRLGIRLVHGPNNAGTEEGYVKEIHQNFKDNEYHAVILDDSMVYKNNYLRAAVAWAKKRSLPVFACPHGAAWWLGRKDHKNIKALNAGVDWLFVFGKEEQDNVSDALKPRTIRGGIPANDILAGMRETEPKHILVFAGWQPSSPYVRGMMRIGDPYKDYSVLSGKVLARCGINELSRRLGLPILIKQKSRKNQAAEDAGLWDGIDEYSILNDVLDDNKLLAEAAVALGSPTTMSLKSMTLGRPTILLRRYGIEGHLEAFDGMVNVKDDILLTEYDRQIADHEGRIEWAERFATGSKNGTASENYLKGIEGKLR